LPLHCNVREQYDSLMYDGYFKRLAPDYDKHEPESPNLYLCISMETHIQIWKFGVMFVVVGLKPFGTPVVLTKHIVHEHYNVQRHR